MPDEQHEIQRWHLDKKVPLALIATIVIQTGIFLWWAATLSERVNTLERNAASSAPQAERLTRVEVRLENVQEGVKRIEEILQRRPAVVQ